MKDRFDWAKEQGFIPKWWEKLPEAKHEAKEKEGKQETSQEKA